MPDRRNVEYAIFTIVSEHLCIGLSMLGVQKANGENLFKKKEKNIISPWIYSRTVINTVLSTVEENFKKFMEIATIIYVHIPNYCS